VTALYRSVLPFIGLLTVSLVLVTAVPWFSTVLVQPAIDDARAMECVQADGLNPQPCSEAERARYQPPDAGSDEGEDDALMKQLLEGTP